MFLAIILFSLIIALRNRPFSSSKAVRHLAGLHREGILALGVVVVMISEVNVSFYGYNRSACI